MIIRQLLKHQWLKTVRAPGFYKNLIANIFFALFGIYVFTGLLTMGFFLHSILNEVRPDMLPIEAFYGVILYVFSADLVMRYFFHQLGTLNLPPYQILPIRRSRLVNYLLLKPLFNPINYLILVVTLPFLVQSAVFVDISATTAFSVALLLIFIIWFDILLISFLKRKFGSGLWGILIILGLIGALVASQYYGLFSLFDISRRFFTQLFNIPFGFLLCLVFPVAAYLLNRRFFSQNYYPEKFNKKISKSTHVSGDFSFMERFGKVGELITLKIKLMLRHKRTKSMLFFSFILLLYGLFFYSSKTYRLHPETLYLIALLLTGALMMSIGPWILNTDGMHFDYLLTKKIDTHTYIHANYYLLVALNVLSFVLSMPYFFYGKMIIYIHISAFLYNLGVNIMIYLLSTPYTAKRLDLSGSSVMNYQGTSYKNFIYLMPMFIFPMIFVGLFSLWNAANSAFVILGIMGALGIIFSKQLLKVVEKKFLQRKYKMCEDFRKKE